MTGDASDTSDARACAPAAAVVSVAGVLGELLITAGVLTLLFVGWQLWIGDMIFGAQRNAEGQDLSEQWEQEYAGLPPPSPSASATTRSRRDAGRRRAGHPARSRPTARCSASCTSRDSAPTTLRRSRAASPARAPSTRSASGTTPELRCPATSATSRVAAHRTTWGAAVQPHRRAARRRRDRRRDAGRLVHLPLPHPRVRAAHRGRRAARRSRRCRTPPPARATSP